MADVPRWQSTTLLWKWICLGDSTDDHSERHLLDGTEGRYAIKGREEPPQGWAGFGQLDLRPVPTLLTSHRSFNTAFLTVMVIQSPQAKPVEIDQMPFKRSNIAREFYIRVDGAEAKILLLDDGTLRVED